MAFEETTIEDLLKRIESIQSAVTSYTGISGQVFPQIKDDITLDRILITELGKLTLVLSNEVAQIAGTLAEHLAVEAQLRNLNAQSDEPPAS